MLRDFLPQFLVSIETNQLRAANTKRYYQRGAKLLDATALREFPLDKLTKSVVAAVKFPHSAYTANNAIRTLSRALGYALELGYMHTAPKLHLHNETPRKMTFSADEEARLLAVAAQPLTDVFVLLMDSGMHRRRCIGSNGRTSSSNKTQSECLTGRPELLGARWA